MSLERRDLFRLVWLPGACCAIVPTRAPAMLHVGSTSASLCADYVDALGSAVLVPDAATLPVAARAEPARLDSAVAVKTTPAVLPAAPASVSSLAFARDAAFTTPAPSARRVEDDATSDFRSRALVSHEISGVANQKQAPDAAAVK